MSITTEVTTEIEMIEILIMLRGEGMIDMKIRIMDNAANNLVRHLH